MFVTLALIYGTVAYDVSNSECTGPNGANYKKVTAKYVMQRLI